MSDSRGAPGLLPIDVKEYGGKKDGERQSSDERLFMQLLVFDVPLGQSSNAVADAFANALRAAGLGGVIYADANAPRGVGLLTWSRDPAHFVDRVRPLFDDSHVTFRDAFTMLGRTYAIGHEPDLGEVLFDRPVRNALHPDLGWHVWYPLRRTGSFARLAPEDHGAVLREHATIGFSYGKLDLAHDIRLACHGLDANDNEFVIGIVAKELHPISHLVQTMRGTRQTSEFIAQMGPFFVGRVRHRIAPR